MRVLFPLNPVYPARPVLEQFAAELNQESTAVNVLGVSDDGTLSVIRTPSVTLPDGTVVDWSGIANKPLFFPTRWIDVVQKPPLGVPAGVVVDFFGNALITLTGVYATDAALILTLGGSQASDPYWRVCDGTNGTPDLRGRFRLGAGQGVGLTDRVFGATGGEEAHALTVAELPSFPPENAAGTNPGYIESPIGTGAPHNTMPPFVVSYPIWRTERNY